MSLLITSNTADNNNTGYNQQGLNKSFSYQNNLNDTFKIPKNSEIAVQSVKINRSGNIDINEANSIFAFYFGEEIDRDNEELDGAGNIYTRKRQRDVQSIPWANAIGGDLDLLNIIQSGRHPINQSLTSETVTNFTDNVNNIARRFQSVLNRSLWHPNLCENASSGINPGAIVTPLRNGSGTDFLGFKIQVTSTDSSKNASNISASWMGAGYNGDEDGNNYTYNPSTRILTAPSSDSETGCVGIDFPLSLTNGSFHISKIEEKSAQYGLSRSLGDEAPSYFDDAGGENFYDYYVEVDSDLDIDLYFIGTEGNGELEKFRVNYGSIINVKDDEITDIIFNVQNERVKVVVINASGVATVLCDGTNTDASKNLKPTSMTCRYLYPKIAMEPGGECKIEQFNGVNLKKSKGYLGVDNTGMYTFTDWWAYHNFNGDIQDQCFNVDVDFKKNITRTHQAGLNSNGQCNYTVQFFFAPDSRYWNTAYCNSQFLVGFPNRSLVNVANSVGSSSPFTLTFESDSPPEIKGTQSLFIRLKNMSFNSVNLSKGSTSKILYHLPAFSNTGERVGALFFEPNERTYLKLGNTEDLFLSTIEIDIVYSDETLANDLQGKTTVVLHIRDA